jgi:hypothetical protein
MAAFFKKLLKGVLIGGGSILSFFAPAIGAPLIVAGAAINTKEAGNNGVDVLQTYANNFQAALSTAGSMQTAGNLSMSGNKFMAWISQNLLLVLGAGAVLLIFLFKRKRR